MIVSVDIPLLDCEKERRRVCENFEILRYWTRSKVSHRGQRRACIKRVLTELYMLIFENEPNESTATLSESRLYGLALDQFGIRSDVAEVPRFRIIILQEADNTQRVARLLLFG